MKNFMQSIQRLTVAIVLLSLVVVGSNAAQKWDLRVSENSRFLQYTDGTPFFWLGDTGWLLPIALNRGEASAYLTRCQQNGFNVVQIQTLSGVPSINAYGQMSNNQNEPWNFGCFDKQQNAITYTYWDHLDFIVKDAERKGIYIAMDCIWGGLVKSGAIDVAGAKAYGTFLAERYKNSPNIIWMIGGDVPGDTKPEIWETLAKTIKSIDKRHLMTYHPRGRYTSAKWWSKADWIDFHMYQSGHRKYGQRMSNAVYPIPDNTEEDCWMYVDSTWAYKPIKPVVDGEPSYEEIPIGLHFPDGPRWKSSDVRRYAYWDVFAGAFGHTYGNNAIMQMYRTGNNVAYANSSKPWYEAQHDSGYVEMQYLKALILALPFFDRVPDQSIIYKGNGEKYERLACTRGKDYLLVYNYTARDMSIDMDKVSGKKKNVWWMNVTDGSLHYLGAFSSGKKQFSAPVQSDFVLIAIDAEKLYIGVEQENILISKKKEKKDLTE